MEACVCIFTVAFAYTGWNAKKKEGERVQAGMSKDAMYWSNQAKSSHIHTGIIFILVFLRLGLSMHYEVLKEALFEDYSTFPMHGAAVEAAAAANGDSLDRSRRNTDAPLGSTEYFDGFLRLDDLGYYNAVLNGVLLMTATLRFVLLLRFNAKVERMLVLIGLVLKYVHLMSSRMALQPGVTAAQCHASTVSRTGRRIFFRRTYLYAYVRCACIDGDVMHTGISRQ